MKKLTFSKNNQIQLFSFLLVVVVFFSCNNDKTKEVTPTLHSTQHSTKSKNGTMEEFTKVVASVIIWHDNKLLLFKRKSNFNELKIGKNIWDLPGGKVDFGEQMKETLQRELTEETSTFLLNDSVSLLDIISYTIQDSTRITHRINLMYSMEYDKVPPITLSEEHSESMFTNSIPDIQKLEMMQPVKDFIISQIVKKTKK
jgi:8-oxo-dGTP diphosphatase